jgi:hypothetical protein
VAALRTDATPLAMRIPAVKWHSPRGFLASGQKSVKPPLEIAVSRDNWCMGNDRTIEAMVLRDIRKAWREGRLETVKTEPSGEFMSVHVVYRKVAA